MNVEIMNEPLRLYIYGFSGTAFNKEYVRTAFKLSAKMWEIVKANNLKNREMNLWVYEPNNTVFTELSLTITRNMKPGWNRKA